jgi:hypothetical protein
MLKHLTIPQVQAIIDQAEKLNQKHAPSELGISLGSVEAIEGVIQYKKDSEPLKREIAALDPEARLELMALMWVGREIEATDFVEALSHARRNSDDHDVDYIAEKSPALPLYLKSGLKKIGANATV